jgi:hypothetical protein
MHGHHVADYLIFFLEKPIRLIKIIKKILGYTYYEVFRV